MAEKRFLVKWIRYRLLWCGRQDYMSSGETVIETPDPDFSMFKARIEREVCESWDDQHVSIKSASEVVDPQPSEFHGIIEEHSP